MTRPRTKPDTDLPIDAEDGDEDELDPTPEPLEDDDEGGYDDEGPLFDPDEAGR